MKESTLQWRDFLRDLGLGRKVYENTNVVGFTAMEHMMLATDVTGCRFSNCDFIDILALNLSFDDVSFTKCGFTNCSWTAKYQNSVQMEECTSIASVFDLVSVDASQLFIMSSCFNSPQDISAASYRYLVASDLSFKPLSEGDVLHAASYLNRRVLSSLTLVKAIVIEAHYQDREILRALDLVISKLDADLGPNRD